MAVDDCQVMTRMRTAIRLLVVVSLVVALVAATPASANPDICASDGDGGDVGAHCGSGGGGTPTPPECPPLCPDSVGTDSGTV